jgi:hypothetical protein
MNLRTDIAIISTATASGGIPEDLQRGLIQVAVGLVTWLLTKLMNKYGTKEKKA